MKSEFIIAILFSCVTLGSSQFVENIFIYSGRIDALRWEDFNRLNYFKNFLILSALFISGVI